MMLLCLGGNPHPAQEERRLTGETAPCFGAEHELGHGSDAFGGAGRQLEHLNSHLQTQNETRRQAQPWQPDVDCFSRALRGGGGLEKADPAALERAASCKVQSQRCFGQGKAPGSQ